MARCKFNTGKDDPSQASFLLGRYQSIFEDLNDGYAGLVRKKKKKKAYQPLTEPFTFESGKISSSARVFSGFTKYNGTFKAKFKGTSQSGKRVKAQLKIVYKSAERAF